MNKRSIFKATEIVQSNIKQGVVVLRQQKLPESKALLMISSLND